MRIWSLRMKTPRRFFPRVGTSCACVFVAWALMLAACEVTPDRDRDDDDDNNNNNTTSTSGSGAGTSTGGSIAQGGAGGSGGALPTVCDYPTGPYGPSVGMTVSKYQSYNGYAPGGQQPTDFRIAELHDCDGTHGVDAILVVTTQYG